MGVIIKDVEKMKQMVVIQGFSQRSFAKHIGISHVQIGNMLNGKRNPSPHTAKKIADALDMEFDDLFTINQ